MPLKIKEVDKVAKLAKLRFSQQEKEELSSQLDKVFAYIEKLGELDTENIEPKSHTHHLEKKLRKDNVEEWMTQDEALANAPKRKRGYFSIPKVIS